MTRTARRTTDLIGIGRDLRDDQIVLDDRDHAGIYGNPDGQTLTAIQLAARTEGMITDPVYAEKSTAGLIDLASRGEIETGSAVLYAHLDGQAVFNAYSALFN